MRSAELDCPRTIVDGGAGTVGSGRPRAPTYTFANVHDAPATQPDDVGQYGLCAYGNALGGAIGWASSVSYLENLPKKLDGPVAFGSDLMMATLENGVTLLLLGATGAVGGQVLRLALSDVRVARVVAPTRRALPQHIKLINPVLSMSGTEVAFALPHIDVAVCAIGTTMREAGSREAFARVDHDLVVSLARLAKQAGARAFVLTSSLGASRGGNFYLRTKAETEDAVGALDFTRYTILRPSMIDAPRAAARPLERVGILVGKLLSPLLPVRYRVVSARVVAEHLIQAALDNERHNECHGSPVRVERVDRVGSGSNR